MDATEILERIQTAHFDLAACQCWVCQAARELGCQPRVDYMKERRKYPVRHDAFDEPKTREKFSKKWAT